MEYITFNFYLFLAGVVLLYYMLPLKFRWFSLFAGSIAFYWCLAQNSKRKFFALFVASFLCWTLALLMEKRPKFRKCCLFIALLGIAIPLLIIKESPFVSAVITHKAMPNWFIVPVGLSFFSLQLIAYVVDVYNKKIEPERNCFHFLLFTSFFPQIIQGPIPRYEQLAPQLIEGHRFNERIFVKGFMLIVWGFFLKLCIADKSGIIVNTVFNNYPTYKGMYVLIAGILYSFQLYTDFLACTTLAQGIAGLFGIEIINNFEQPYFSMSIKDFWRRWHISLSTWLRDYIYIPLGGNRKGKARKYLNLIITFGVSGVWHGPGYKFVFWGFMHAFYQIMGELLMPVKQFIDEKAHLNTHSTFKAICKTIYTFFMVMFTWIIFRADYLRTGLSMIKSIFTVHNPWILTDDSLFELGLDWKEVMILIICLIILLVVSLAQAQGVMIREKILECNLLTRWVIYIGAILFVLVFGTYGYGFDPQAFIYGGF